MNNNKRKEHPTKESTKPHKKENVSFKEATEKEEVESLIKKGNQVLYRDINRCVEVYFPMFRERDENQKRLNALIDKENSELRRLHIGVMKVAHSPSEVSPLREKLKECIAHIEELECERDDSVHSIIKNITEGTSSKTLKERIQYAIENITYFCVDLCKEEVASLKEVSLLCERDEYVLANKPWLKKLTRISTTIERSYYRLCELLYHEKVLTKEFEEKHQRLFNEWGKDNTDIYEHTAVNVYPYYNMPTMCAPFDAYLTEHGVHIWHIVDNHMGEAFEEDEFYNEQKPKLSLLKKGPTARLRKIMKVVGEEKK